MISEFKSKEVEKDDEEIISKNSIFNEIIINPSDTNKEIRITESISDSSEGILSNKDKDSSLNSNSQITAEIDSDRVTYVLGETSAIDDNFLTTNGEITTDILQNLSENNLEITENESSTEIILDNLDKDKENLNDSEKLNSSKQNEVNKDDQYEIEDASVLDNVLRKNQTNYRALGNGKLKIKLDSKNKMSFDSEETDPEAHYEYGW